MKRIILVILSLSLSLSHSVYAQTRMIINKTNGTADSVLLSNIKNITFGTTPVAGTIILYDSFDANINNWTGWGDPLPLCVASGFGRTGLFDNNGDANYGSGGYSKTAVTTTGGMLIEADIYLNITDQTGCWLGSSIGLTNTTNPTPSSVDLPEGLLFTMEFSGDACWGDSVKYQRHKWFAISLWPEDGTWDYPAWNRAPYLNADSYSSTAWHTLRIDITPSRIVNFYCDNKLIWTSVKKINPSMLSNKNVVLGERSSGSAGKAYHDWVKVTTY